MSGNIKVPDRVKEVAQEDFDKAKQLAQDAIRSAAYLYPFKVRTAIGVMYLESD